MPDEKLKDARVNRYRVTTADGDVHEVHAHRVVWRDRLAVFTAENEGADPPIQMEVAHFFEPTAVIDIGLLGRLTEVAPD